MIVSSHHRYDLLLHLLSVPLILTATKLSSIKIVCPSSTQPPLSITSLPTVNIAVYHATLPHLHILEVPRIYKLHQ